jgi:hypothetical protein
MAGRRSTLRADAVNTYHGGADPGGELVALAGPYFQPDIRPSELAAKQRGKPSRERKQ